MQLVWACVFAISAALVAAAEQEGEDGKPWRGGGKEEWEAAGGWEQHKYQRWQDGQLMFSRIEVELVWIAIVFMGLVYACWTTMPDGSGEEGKYMSPRAIQALEQASAEARKKGEALQETAAQEEFVQHLQRDIDAVQREIDTATPRPDAMLAQSRLQNALDRELALRQRCATLSEELAEAKSELETAQQHTAMLRQEQLEQRQRKEEPVASTKPEEEGHGGNDGRVQAEDEVEETQRQQEEAQGDGAGDDDVDEDKSDQVHKRRSRGAASEQAPGKQELSTLDKGSGSIDATISMHQNSNSNGGGGGGGGSGGRRRRLRLRSSSSSSSSSSGSGSGSGATSSGSDDSDDVDSSNGSDGHALPPAEYFNVALVVNASVRRVRMEISNRGLSVASGREGLAGGVQDIFCYSWAQVSNWSLYKSGTKSGIVFAITEVGSYDFRTKKADEIVEATMRQINFILAARNAEPARVAHDQAIKHLMLLGVSQRRAAEVVELTKGDFRAAAQELNFELQVATSVRAPIGLPNRSNDCFWLATVQCLRHLPRFARMVTSSTERALQRPPVNVAHALANLLLRMERQRDADHLSSRCPELNDFIRICERNLPKDDGHALVQSNFRLQDQEDSNEFLNQLLNALTDFSFQGGDDTGHLGPPPTRSTSWVAEDESKRLRLSAIEEELTEHSKAEDWGKVYELVSEFADIQWDTSRLRLRSGVGELLEGQRLVVMQCSACGRWSAGSADSFLMEEVRVQPSKPWAKVNNSLASMLRDNTARDTPEGYRCDGCGAADTTMFRDGLRKLPQVYAVHINRTLPNGTRCSEPVQFEDTIDLQDMLLYKRKGPIDYSNRPCASTYTLAAVTFHRGLSARSGHYVACVRDVALGASPIFRVLKWLKVSKDIDPSSEEIMEAEPGLRLVCLEERDHTTGFVRRSVARMRCQYGWVTQSAGSLARTSGWTELDDDEVNECGPRATPQMFEQSRAGSRAAMLFYVRDDLDEPGVEPEPADAEERVGNSDDEKGS